MNTLPLLLEAFFLSLALAVDSLAVGFSYGASRIRIPLPSLLLIDGVCSAGIGVMLAFGSAAKGVIPPVLTDVIGFAVLFVIGVVKLMDGLVKALIKKQGFISKNLHFSFFHFRFILTLYADPESADLDNSKTISPREALSLAAVLALDGCAVSFGAALGTVNGPALFLFSVLMQFFMLVGGCALGNRMAHKLKTPVSWVGGLLLIALAFFEVFFS